MQRTYRTLRHRALGLVPATLAEQAVAGGAALGGWALWGPVAGFLAGVGALGLVWGHRHLHHGRFSHLDALRARVARPRFSRGPR